jgi:hypothetical protein
MLSMAKSINLKTVKTPGLSVPRQLLARVAEPI